MIGSLYHLEHRINELVPSERDQEIARRLRDAASSPRTVVRIPDRRPVAELNPHRRTASLSAS